MTTQETHIVKCKNGHPYDDANTYRSPRGDRQCRACVREASRRYRATPQGANVRQEYDKAPQRRLRFCSPEKRRVHRQVQLAIHRGLLVRPSRCSSCGTNQARIHAHHEDYAKPLVVQWLCSRCHARVHGWVIL